MDIKELVAAQRRGTRVDVPLGDGSIAIYYRPVDGNTGFRAAVEMAVNAWQQRARAEERASLSDAERAEATKNPFGPAGMRVYTAGMTVPAAVREAMERDSAHHLLTGWDVGEGFVSATDAPELAADVVSIDAVWIALLRSALSTREIDAVEEALLAVVEKKRAASSRRGSSSTANSSPAPQSGSEPTTSQPSTSESRPEDASPGSGSPPASRKSTRGGKNTGTSSGRRGRATSRPR